MHDSVSMAAAEARRLLAERRLPAAVTQLKTASSQPAARRLLRELLVSERRPAELEALLQSPADASGPVEQEIEAALLAHLRGDFAAAAAACRRALELEPSHPAALLHLGRALHNLGQPGAALQSLRRAVFEAPSFAEGWHALGIALRASGDFAAAGQALGKAVALCPALCQARVDLAVILQAEGRLDEAIALYRQVLADDPEHVGALVDLGLALQLVDDTVQARACYERALALQPRHVSALYYYGSLLNAELDHEGALEKLRAALALDPQDADAWYELAGAHEKANQLDQAQQALQRGLAVAPAHPGLNIEAARAERRAGRLDAALARLRRIDRARLMPRTATEYFYELGWVLDRMNQPAEAMQAFAEANRLAAESPRQRRADPQRFHERVARMQAHVEAGMPAPLLDADEADCGAGLCFLVGFPRSGTTLLDTLLDASPEVRTIDERETLERLASALARGSSGYPAAIARLDRSQRDALRKLYFERLGELGITPSPGVLIADKLPLRVINLPLVQALFPAARVVFSLRHPCDVVLSNYMQHFAVNDAFSNFLDLASTVDTYDAVMRLWQAMAPKIRLPLHRLRYEALVEAPEAELAKTCEFLGITYTPAMLDPAQRLTGRERIRTNSYHQVAEPIYRRAAGRWQRYRPWLEPHMGRLSPHAEYFGYSMR